MSYISYSARIRLQNVVLATDFSEASMAAVGYAVAVAKHYQGRVYVVHVVPPEVYSFTPPETIPMLEKGVKNWVQEQMRRLLDSHQLRDVPHEGIVQHGEIWDALEPIVRRHSADLIVAGTRGRRGLRKLIMGSVAEEILRLSPVPVLTVRPDAAQADPQLLRTILYPTDFSADSIRALAYAFSLAQEFQSCMIVLHVAPGTQEEPHVRDRLQAFFSDQLGQIVPPETTPWCERRLVIEFGDPTEAILKCADAYKADLIVMGVRGAGSMVRASTHFGSTAYRVISEARAPVLSVRQLRQDMFR